MCPGSVEAAGAGAGKSVCVMDAAGPLGHALVDRLLRRGYTVHAATYGRSGDEEEDEGESATAAALLLEHLSRSGGDAHRHRLKVFRADPFDYHAIADAVRGCAGVFCMFNTPHDQAQCDLWHALAKTLSEKTAWALAMDRGVDMVAINAGLLTAPELTAAHPYLKGAPDMYDAGVLVTVDADFLADAHVAAYESPTAHGRYLCFNNAVCRPEDAVKLAQMLSPSAPHSPPSDELKVIPQRIQNKKLSKLMLEFASGVYGELD
ncbi:unnamed protein product [Urochloa humidicola]